MPGLGNPVAFTGNSMRALALSVAFTKMFGGKRDKPVAHKLDLLTPPGTSTEGASAAQTLRIAFGPQKTMVLGTADTGNRRAAFVPYEELAADFTKQHGGSLPMSRAAYDAIVRELGAFFTEQKLAVAGHEAPVARHPAPEERRSRLPLLALVGALLIAAAAAALLIAAR